MASLARQIAEDLALKMRLEKELETTFKRMFKHMAVDAKVHYKETQNILDTRRYEPEIIGTLRQHYRKVANAFDDRLRARMKKCFRNLETKGVDDKIKKKLSDFIDRRSLQQTYFISQTNAQEMLNAFGSAYYDIAFQGLAKDKVADQAAEAFAIRALGRAYTIGQTETQFMAEATKDIEADEIVLAEIGAQGEIIHISKVWTALLDDKTRPAHVEADFQVVPQGDPFIVMNQKLMYPGDTSMGATLDNIINCRCNSERAIDNSGLSDFEEGIDFPRGF